MMKKRTKIRSVFTLLFFLIAIGLLFYYMFEDNEGYVINTVEARLFAIERVDSSGGCTTLIDIKDFNRDSPILGVRFITKRVNKSNRILSSIFSEFKQETRYDSIQSLTVTISGILQKEIGLKVREFKLKGNEKLDRHSINSLSNCYLGSYHIDMGDLKNWYNNLTWHDPAISNFSFYSLGRSSRTDGNSQVTLTLELQDGRTISQKVK